MSFSQASLGNYHDSCLYFIAGVAGNCSLPAILLNRKAIFEP